MMNDMAMQDNMMMDNMDCGGSFSQNNKKLFSNDNNVKLL